MQVALGGIWMIKLHYKIHNFMNFMNNQFGKSHQDVKESQNSKRILKQVRRIK